MHEVNKGKDCCDLLTFVHVIISMRRYRLVPFLVRSWSIDMYMSYKSNLRIHVESCINKHVSYIRNYIDE